MSEPLERPHLRDLPEHEQRDKIAQLLGAGFVFPLWDTEPAEGQSCPARRPGRGAQIIAALLAEEHTADTGEEAV